MIKLHTDQAKFSAIHSIQILQLPAITDLTGFKLVHVIYVAHSPKCISTTLRAHTHKGQAAELQTRNTVNRSKKVTGFVQYLFLKTTYNTDFFFLMCGVLS